MPDSGAHSRDLTLLDLGDRAEFGGKAVHLGHAARLGCPVLGGVALSTWLYQRFVEQGGLLSEVTSILNTMQPRTMPQFEAAAWAIRSAFGVRRMPTEVRQELLAAWHALGAPRVALRSSSTIEDSPTRSFVGQHASTLDISDDEGLLAAALESWASLFSAKSLSYAHRFGVDLLPARMGLLLQPMVTPEARGALFTADPITGDPDRFILEIHQGPEHGVFDLDPYSRKPGELSYWSQLRYYGLLLDERDLAYQTIEWVIDQGRLTFIRVRPATAVPAYVPARAVPRDLEPVALVTPGAATGRELQPYTPYHLSRHGLGARGSTAGGAEPPREIQVCGYLYRATAEADTGAALELGALGLMAQAVRTANVAARSDQEASLALNACEQSVEELTRGELASLPDGELARLLEQVRDIGDVLIARCHVVNDALRDLLTTLARVKSDWAGVSETLASTAGSAETGPSGASLELPGCAETWLLQEIIPPADVAQEGQRGVAAPVERAPIEPEPAVVARLNRLRRPIYELMVERAHRLQATLERVWAAAARCRAREYAAVLDAGRRLHAVGLASELRDAALLEARELDRWLYGELRDEQVVRAVMRRRDEQRRAWRYAPPQALGGQEQGGGLDMGGCDMVLRGVAVSAGAVRGRARVVRSLTEAPTVLPGEVLVCQQATYELSPLFSAVAAIVTAQGALLDHGGVLVREYGLPAVFAVTEITERIRTGDELLVDAVRGLVGRVGAPRSQLRIALDAL
jgi:phosphohistidine swiveling domain-containing protein